MKKILWISTIMISTLAAVDFRIGSGSYETDIAIKSFMKHNTDNDITVFSLKEEHADITQTPLFYYYDGELYTSSKKRQTTEFAGYMASYQFPLVGSVNDMTNHFIGMFPVDGDYKAVGFDMNMGLGYDLLSKDKSYLGIALNLGATLPTINAENLSTKASLAYDLIERWDLDVCTYKIGPMLKGALMLSPQVSLYGSFSLGFQKASVKSGLFKSSLDVNGDYSALDMGLKYHPHALWTLPKNLYFVLGYTYKHWDVNSAEVNLYNFFQTDLFAPFTTELKSRYMYVGVGYQF